MNRKQPNLKDVAQLAGVSTATVSAVVNNRVGQNIRVGKETQQRIVDAVRMLGYVANPAARSLVGQKNQIISIFTYESVFPFESHDFYYPFLVGIEKEAEKQGYDLLFMTSTSHSGGTRTIYRHGMNRLRLADGAILLGASRNETEILDLAQENFPFVCIGHREFPGAEVSYVAANYTEVTAEIVTAIVQKGHRKIALIRIVDEIEPSADREAGFRLAHKILGIPLHQEWIIRKVPETISTDFVRSLLAKGISAFITGHYTLARKLLDAAQELNLEIPKDFSVAVLGGPKDMECDSMDWTTFRIPAEEMGIHAVRLLLKLLDGVKPPLRMSLECKMIQGSTVDAGPYQTS